MSPTPPFGPNPDRLYTLPQAAEILGCSPERVRALIRAAVIPATRFGGYWRIRGLDLRSYLYRANEGRTTVPSLKE